MSATEWYVGMCVVCIDDEGFRHAIRRGQTYTVKAIVPWYGYFKKELCNFLALELAEARNPSDDLDPDAPKGFASLRFRPVQTRKTSIEVFTRMLNPQKQGIDA